MTAQTFAIAGLVISLLVASTSTPVSKFIAPTGPGFWAIPRTLLSVLWFTFVPFAAIVAAVIFGVMLLFV